MDEHDVIYKGNALTPYSEAETLGGSISTVNADIRNWVKGTIRRNDVWSEISPYLIPEGAAGNTQFDHCEVASIVLDNCPELEGYENLNKFALWKHIEFVLRRRGYEFARGRVVGLKLIADQSKSDKVAEANQANPDEVEAAA